MSPACGERASARKLSERFHRESGKSATTSKSGNDKADSEQVIATAYMALSQAPRPAGIRPAHPIGESTAVTPHKRETSKRFKAGVTMTDPTPITATALTASSKSTSSSGTKPASSMTESAAKTPLKKKSSKVELTLSSIKSKVSTIKKSAISQAKSLASMKKSLDPA
ncbi:hypothetical protein HDU88_000405, partial [Geranomyces variabilis]